MELSFVKQELTLYMTYNVFKILVAS